MLNFDRFTAKHGTRNIPTSLECTKCVFGRGFSPLPHCMGSLYSAPRTLYSWFKGHF